MPAEDDFKKFSDIAEDLGLESDEREDFISSAMKRKGYSPKTMWTDPEPDNSKDNTDYFAKRRRESSKPEPKRNTGQYGA